MVYEFKTLKSTPVKYETVSLGDCQYQVPAPIAKELTNMANIIEAQNIDIDEARTKRREENEVIANRVMMNLISGEPYGNSVLKHKIDHFTEAKNGCPIFAFREDVENRILLALEGKNMEGEANNVGNGVWKTEI